MPGLLSVTRWGCLLPKPLQGRRWLCTDFYSVAVLEAAQQEEALFKLTLFTVFFSFLLISLSIDFYICFKKEFI